MPDQKEIDRVRRIHEQLDVMAALPLRSDAMYEVALADGQKLAFTADEIRKWPGMKAAMVENMRENPYAAMAFAGTVLTNNELASGRNFYPDSNLRKARGLVMYREMLNEPARTTNEDLEALACAPVSAEHALALSTGRPLTNGPVRVNEAQAEALGIRKADPYTGHDVKHERHVAESQRVTDLMSGARDRLVAALASEMRRPVAPRFPSEARSERCFEAFNPRFR